MPCSVTVLVTLDKLDTPYLTSSIHFAKVFGSGSDLFLRIKLPSNIIV